MKLVMSVLINVNNLPPFPKCIPEKLKTIREYLKLTPAEIAFKISTHTGAESLAYESGDEFNVSVLWTYARLAG